MLVFCARPVYSRLLACGSCHTLAESSLKIRCACTRASRVRAHTLLHDEAGVWRLTTQGGSRLHTSGTLHGVYFLHRGAMRRRGDPRISYARGSARRLITHNHEKSHFGHSMRNIELSYLKNISVSLHRFSPMERVLHRCKA